MITCIHGFVSGRVQGVWFRAYTRDQALALGISGWVRNVSDGRVECWLEGSEQQLKAMKEKLQKGPPLSRVDHIDWFTPAPTASSGFTILSTVPI